MQKVTRRPSKKKNPGKVNRANMRRQARAQARERARKRKRKFLRLVEEVGIGNYDGVKSSPLLHANWGRVMAILRSRYGMSRKMLKMMSLAGGRMGG